MAGLLSVVGADPRMVLMPGLFAGAGPDRFGVWPRKKIAREILGINPDTVTKRRLAELTRGWFEHQDLRVVARTRDNTIFSSWSYLDRDLVPGMPDELAELDRDEWLEEMAELWPTFGEAGKVIVPSTSGRILVDGEPYSTKPSFHCFFQVDDPDELRNRVWPQLLIKSFAATVLLSDCALGSCATSIRAGAGPGHRPAGVEHLGSDDVLVRAPGVRRRAGGRRRRARGAAARAAGRDPGRRRPGRGVRGSHA